MIHQAEPVAVIAGETLFHCPECGFQMLITAEGAPKILETGDEEARHVGSTIPA